MKTAVSGCEEREIILKQRTLKKYTGNVRVKITMSLNQVQNLTFH